MASAVPPGPRGSLLLGSTPDFWRDSIGTLMDAWRQHGDVVRFRLGGPLTGYLLARPEHVEHVLQKNHRNYRKVPWYNARFKELVGEGLLTSEGDRWLRQRRLMQPAFHRERLASLAGVMTAAAEETSERWREPARRGEPVDVAAEMMRLTLAIVARALLGAEVSREAEAVGASVTVGLHHLMRRMQSYVALPEWLPLPRHLRFLAARRTLDAIVYRIVEERRRAPGDDLVSMLLAARDPETGQAMSGRQLRDEVMTIFLAGHETTAVALAWTWYLLSTHPDVDCRLREELATVLDGRAPTLEDLPKLRYTDMVVQEAMRLYPPAWMLSRTPLRDDEVAGYRLPVGSIVFVSPYVTHRHGAFWENPDTFDPERFTLERSSGRPRFAYFPFGGGPRQCIGAPFAMMEAQLILATLAQRYRPELVPGHPVALDPQITLRPKHGMVMTLKQPAA